MIFSTQLHAYPQVQSVQLRESADSSVYRQRLPDLEVTDLNSVFLALKPSSSVSLSVIWRRQGQKAVVHIFNASTGGTR